MAEAPARRSRPPTRRRASSSSGGEELAPVDAEGPPLLCAGCRADLSNEGYAEFVEGWGDAAADCRHIHCLECFGSAHAERSANIKLQCRGSACSYFANAWEIHSRTGRSAGRRRVQEQRIRKPSSYEDRFYHPNLFYREQPAVYRKTYSLLSLVVPNKKDATLTNCYVAELRHAGDIEEITDDNRKMLSAIGQSLHPCFLQNKQEQDSRSHHAYAGGESIPQLEQKDGSNLRLFNHTLATGLAFEPRGEDEERKAMEQRTYNMTFAATDLMRTAKGGGVRGSRLKDYLSDHLNISGVTDRIKDLFSSVGMSRSRNYMNLAQDRAVDAIIRQGWDPKGRGYGVLAKAYDNMGMRKRAGYVQYVLIMILHLSVENMISMKIYPDPQNKNYAEAKAACLSRERLSWGTARMAERGDEGFYEFEISREDARTMAREMTLPSIEFVLQALKDGVLPPLEQAVQRVQNDNFPRDSKQKISRAASGRVIVKGSEDRTLTMGQLNVEDSGVNDIDELDDDHLESEGKTIYDVNNAVTDLPWKMDLNNTDTVKKILKATDDLRLRCLNGTVLRPLPDADDAEVADGDDPDAPSFKGNPWAENGWPPEHQPEPWMRTEGCYLCGDGSPTYAANKLQREQRLFREMNVLPVNGIFHTMLEMHKLRGKMFGPSHLREIWANFRKTKGQQDWVLNPGDPNQCEAEMAAIYLAMIAAVVYALLEKRQEEGSGGIAGVSAMDVFDFMQEAAQTSPIIQVIYNEMRGGRQCKESKICDDSPIINVEMIDLPVRGETRMDSFIDVKLKKTGEMEEEGPTLKESQLLQQIQPTIDKQKDLDEINLERSVSTTISYVVANYTAKELAAVYKVMKNDWVLDEAELPEVEGTKKYYFAKAITEARKKLMANDPNWERATREMLTDEIEKRNEAARNEIQERLDRIGASNFFRLGVEGSGLRAIYSERHVLFQQPNQQGGGNGGQAAPSGRIGFINAIQNRNS